MVYGFKEIISYEDFDFILEDIEEYSCHLGGDLKIGWYEDNRWCPTLQWKMPDGYEFQHKKVGIAVITNPTVMRYETGSFRMILDNARKIYFGGEIFGQPGYMTGKMQFGPKRSIKMPDGFDPSRCNTSLGSDTLWVFLETPGFPIWGHWIVDHFPRLYLLYKLGLIDRVKFVFFKKPPEWSHIFFDVFSISKDRFVVVDEHCFRAEHLIIPAFFREQNHLFIEYVAESWQFLKQKLLEKRAKENFISRFFCRNQYLKKVRKNIGKENLRVYISRRNCVSAIENEKEFQILLLRYGFVTFFPEKIDLATTAGFLEHADMVVGEDGSGMHNVVFCKKDCDVIVINSRIRPKIDLLRENRYQLVINANLFDKNWFYTPRFEGGKVAMDIDDFEEYLKNIIDGQ